jgi:hypothetical protein
VAEKVTQKPDAYLVTPNDHQINTLFAWLSVDANGMEGIMSVLLGDQHFPCVMSTATSAMRLVPTMQEAAKQVPSRRIRLVQYERGKELTEVKR